MHVISAEAEMLCCLYKFFLLSLQNLLIRQIRLKVHYNSSSALQSSKSPLVDVPTEVQARSIASKEAGLIGLCPCNPRAAVRAATEPMLAAAAICTCKYAHCF